MTTPINLQIINYIDEWEDELGDVYKKDCYKVVSPNGSIIYEHRQDYIKYFYEDEELRHKQITLNDVMNETAYKIKQSTQLLNNIIDNKIKLNIQFITMNGTVIDSIIDTFF